jgi:hypothetical protein
MSENGRAGMLIERASSLGLEVSFDSTGFLMVSHSAGIPPRRDDAAEMEHGVVESLGGCLADVRDLAVAQSCSARGRNFVGCRAYIPSEDIVGTISSAEPDGITLTYSIPTNEEDVRDRTSNITVPGWRLFVIVSADELPPQIPSSAYASISSDRLRGLFERAESVGLRLEHDAGLILVRFPPTGTAETDAIEATVRALGRSIREVRDFVIAQSRGARGAAFIGRRIFVPEFGAFGVLTSCHNDGVVGVTYEREIGVVTCLCGGDRLLVLDFEETTSAASPDQKSEATWQKLVRRARSVLSFI